MYIGVFSRLRQILNNSRIQLFYNVFLASLSSMCIRRFIGRMNLLGASISWLSLPQTMDFDSSSTHWARPLPRRGVIFALKDLSSASKGGFVVARLCSHNYSHGL